VIVPLGIWLAVRLIPPEVMAEHRATAAAMKARPSSTVAAVVIVGIWLAAAVALAWLALAWFT
jgi:hypothetical protein